MAKQNSASNVLERPPVSVKATADVKGTHGSGFASLLIRAIEQAAEKDVKVQTSLKDRLRGMADFSGDDHIAFRLELQKWVDHIGEEADKVKLSVTQFRKSAPIINYTYVNLSVFKMLSKALESGWEPNYDKSWQEIQDAARERLSAKAATEKQAEIQKELATVAARPAETEEAKKLKEAEILVLNEKMKAVATTTATKASGTSGGAGKTNFQKACEMLAAFPLQDRELVRDWLIKNIADATKNKPGVTSTSKPDPVETASASQPRTPAPREAIAASGGTRKAKAKANAKRK